MALVRTLELPDRLAMGTAGRAKVEREFDEQIVIGRYLQALGMLGAQAAVRPVPLADPMADPLTEQEYLTDH
jgi:hypothetical protein